MKKTSKPLSKQQKAELRALARIPDEDIDLSDAAPLADWSNATRGRFYKPVKQQLTIRLDADVIAWFKRSAGSADDGYQTRINSALRDYVQGQVKRESRKRPA
jgi:uncharacterized protein (DUF4415 family)